MYMISHSNYYERLGTPPSTKVAQGSNTASQFHSCLSRGSTWLVPGTSFTTITVCLHQVLLPPSPLSCFTSSGSRPSLSLPFAFLSLTPQNPSTPTLLGPFLSLVALDLYLFFSSPYLLPPACCLPAVPASLCASVIDHFGCCWAVC